MVSEIPEFIQVIHKDIKKKLQMSIYQQAFTDPSYDRTKRTSNDRLEAIGDKILDFILYDKLYHSTNYNKIQMDYRRQVLLSESELARIYDELEFNILEEFLKIQKGQLINTKIKHRLIEALFGAIFIDSDRNYESVYEYWNFLGLDDIIPLFD